MSVDRFRFVSPGVFINEIDQSGIPSETSIATGPAIIGRTQRGPALVPTQIGSFDNFVQTFGNPIPGGKGGDVWIDGNYAAPTYAAYAAQAYLANNGPITVVRLLGDQSPKNDGSLAGMAGWTTPDTTTQGDVSTSDGRGVYGLWIFSSGSQDQGPGPLDPVTGGTPSDQYSDGVNTAHISGTLAAKFYVNLNARIELSGSPLSFSGSATRAAIVPLGSNGMQSNAIFLQTVTNAGVQEFKIVVTSGSAEHLSTTFNFNPTSARYIRKVLNTNPQLTNSNITPAANLEPYWLGETFDRNIKDQFPHYASADNVRFGVILGMGSGSSYPGGYFKTGYQLPQTPPIIGQDLNAAGTTFNVNNTTQELFTIIARDDAEWIQKNIKISIIDVKASPNPEFEPYGTFGIQVRDLADSDNTPIIREQFNNLTLNSDSPNYVARRIGNTSYTWDSTNKKYRQEGEYPNRSKFIRMSMATGQEGLDSALLPFGFKGVPKWTGFNFASGSALGQGNGAPTRTLDLNNTGSSLVSAKFAALSGAIFMNPVVSNVTNGLDAIRTVWKAGGLNATGEPVQAAPITASFQYPILPQRFSSSDGGLVDNTNAYWGLTTTKSRTSTVFDPTVREYLRMVPVTGFNRTDPTANSFQERGPGFTLDDLCFDLKAGGAYHSGSAFGPAGFAAYMQTPWSTVTNASGATDSAQAWGSRADGTSMTAVSASYQEVLNKGYDRFTVPLFGGFDGVEITEKDPFNNTRALGGEAPSTAPTEEANAMVYTVKKAIDTVADPELVDINLGIVPGITPRIITGHLLEVCQDRADALAIIDLEGGYVPVANNTDSFADRAGNVDDTVTNIKQRALNNSYGAAYYPWVMSSDTLSGIRVWMPPSVVALGTYGSSAAVSELWFAPAGFNRGGLSQGSAGIPVLGIVDKLTSKQRDKLYEVNINPIATFPAEGIVIFGQKTLQATRSALDRVNVRRLMIFLKKQISRIARNILFDPNVQVTWDRFLGQVNPLLRSVKANFGLQEYRVILDESTTTPELVDRNIMYAKVFLKPTRAIEFIALDFIITRSGASFND